MKNIFGMKTSGSRIRLDSFFIETALILPVFAICCCTVLRMLGTAAHRAEKEQIYASAVACCESWCELYSATGDLERTAEELFGADAAEKKFNGSGYEFSTGNDCRTVISTGNIDISVSESVTECMGADYAYGQLFSSVIHISWEDRELTEEAVFYAPYPILIPLESGDEE